MPYGRKKFFKRRPYRRYKKKYTPLRRKVYKIARSIQAEKRFDSGVFGLQTGAQAGVLFSLISMVRGDDNGEREGTKILVHHLDLRIAIRSSSTTATNISTLNRVMLLKVKQNNGATSISNSNLLLNGGADANNYMAPINPLYSTKIRTMKDKTVSINPIANTRAAVGTTTQDNPVKHLRWKWHWKKGLVISFDGNNGTMADVVTNALILVIYEAFADGLSAHNVSFRLIYTP